MGQKKYLTRIYDDILAWRLQTKGAVLVEGAKWCGKTSTAEQLAQGVAHRQDPGMRDRNCDKADREVDAVVALHDEWMGWDF